MEEMEDKLDELQDGDNPTRKRRLESRISNLNDKCLEIRIINSNGVCVYKDKCIKTEIKTDKLAAGIYFVLILNEDFNSNHLLFINP